MKGGDRLLVLDGLGRVFISYDGSDWERPLLPTNVSEHGWKRADIEGEILALANGTMIEVIDLRTGEHETLVSPPVKDLDLEGSRLAIASFEYPDVYDLENRSWMDSRVTKALGRVGGPWTEVMIPANELVAVDFSGIVVTVDTEVQADVNDVIERGSLPDGLDSNVTDLALLDNATFLLTTMKGSWVVTEADTVPFSTSRISMPPTNDIRSVRHEEDTLWTVTPQGLSFLSFDSRGQPSGWVEGPFMGEGISLGPLEAAKVEGTVYITGYGYGIHTYDTFASSAPDRWDIAHMYGDARDDVRDLVLVNGT
ncbi:MAG: hypothetical protein JSW25_04975, partial [Thermoplasmata archaeon]